MTRPIAQRTRLQHHVEPVERRRRLPSRQSNPAALAGVEGDQGGEGAAERRRRVSRKGSCSLQRVYREVIEDISDQSARRMDGQYEGIE